jgi:hypothetical protein
VFNTPRVFIGMLEGSERRTPEIVTHNLSRAVKYAEDYGAMKLEKFSTLSGIALVSGARDIQTKEMLKTKATHMLIIDNDMAVIKPDAIKILLDRQKDIICGMYTSRMLPLRLVCRLDASVQNDDSAEYDLIKKAEPFKVETAGFGFILIRRKVFEAVYEHCKHEEFITVKGFNLGWETMPFMPFVYKGTYNGEDGSFCIRAKQCGFDTWVDPSVLLGHMGSYPFTIIDWLDYYEQKQGIKKVQRFETEKAV